MDGGELLTLNRTNIDDVAPNRRQHITVVKEVVEEFEGYLKEAEEKAQALAVGGRSAALNEEVDDCDDGEAGEDDDHDGDDEEQDYTMEEISMVTATVDTIKLQMELLRVGLDIVTTVADATAAVSVASETSGGGGSDVGVKVAGAGDSNSGTDIPLSIFKAPDNPLGSDAEGARGSEGSGGRCGVWVSRIMRLCAQCKDATIDAGAELYPPVDAPTLGTHLLRLKDLRGDMLALLRDPLFLPLVPPTAVEKLCEIEARWDAVPVVGGTCSIADVAADGAVGADNEGD